MRQRFQSYFAICVLAGGGSFMFAHAQTRRMENNARADCSVGVIADKKGEVWVRRKDSSRESPARQFQLIRHTDKLRIAKSAKIVVACPDLSKHKLTDKTFEFPCPAKCNARLQFEMRGGNKISSTRGKSDVPTILQPR
ncbi:MAG: hypothetical protein ACREEM_40970, partial [Blastocatellia bacterium]